MSTYEPGTVAVATVYGVRGVRVMRGAKDQTVPLVWTSSVAIKGAWWFAESDVTDVRPLIVLDLDAEWADNAATLIKHLRIDNYPNLADQIEAQTKPPKPAEPTGLGAVVETDGGVRFVRLPDGIWTSEDESQPWDNVNAVKVLSKGVIS